MGRSGSSSPKPARTRAAPSAPPAVDATPFSIDEEPEKYTFRLYVAGSNLKSRKAIEKLRELCALLPQGRCKSEVIDLYQQPDMARRDNILAAPTLVKVSPPPRRVFVGIVDDTVRILHKLGIPIADAAVQRKKS